MNPKHRAREAGARAASDRQLELPAVDAATREPLEPWPLPSTALARIPAASRPARIDLVPVAYPCDGWLRLNWPTIISAGRDKPTYRAVLVVGETVARLRIEARERTWLEFSGRWLEPGEATYVPRGAVAFERPEP